MTKNLSTWKPQNETTDQYLEEIGIEPASWNLDRMMFIRGLSAKALARKISYSDSIINLWRKSETVPKFKIARQAIPALARGLACEPLDLFCDPSALDELEAD